jgi:E3 ubiquitin-protein ligase HERC2
MNLTYSIKEKNFLHGAITDNLSLVSSRARLNIFNERLDKMKMSINPNEKELNISRIKAIKFYEKNIVDSLGEYTIFGQLYNKMKKYTVSKYLCKRDNRLFVVNLTGEGATDYGGPYREVFSTACEELHSNYLDLFIKSPNNKNEIGALRDKYIINPNAKSAMHIDMYFFIGCLIGYAISSAHLLNLNIHPVIWKLILNEEVSFLYYECIDKLFFKYLNDIAACDQEDLASLDLYYSIQLSDGNECDLILNGKKIAVDNKEKFISLAKSVRMNEFKIGVEAIRYGIM